jgi:hypothetical protein
VIKIIKRNAKRELPPAVLEKLPESQAVTATVNDWIAESRQIRLDEHNSSRKTIADWAAETSS